jgi:hypothetical protein
MNGKGRSVRTDIYAELYLWNKDIDSLMRVLERLEALRVLPRRTLKEREIRLDELRCAVNVGILEIILKHERTDHWRLSRQREALDDAGCRPRTVSDSTFSGQ